MSDGYALAAHKWLAEHPNVKNLCGDAAFYLMKEAGLEPRGGWWNDQPHCWNVADDGTIYDLTRSQFTGEPPQLSVFAADSAEARWSYREATPEDLLPLRINEYGARA